VAVFSFNLKRDQESQTPEAMEHKITALKLQKRNRQRVNVYLDGEFAFGLSRIVAAWLNVGQVLSDEKIASLQAEDSREVAFQQALKFLNYRARAEAEVRRNLVENGFSEEVIVGTLERLRENGLLNDAQFAQTWVENRATFRPRSRRALGMELRQRGLDDETIDGALEEIDDEEQAYQAALAYARKLENKEWKDFRQKLSSFLARRGFSYDVVAPVVERVWKEKSSDTPAGEDDW